MSQEPLIPENLRAGLVETAEEVRQLLRQALLLAASQGGRELCWLDTDFAAWPLSDPELLDALHRWALPHRRLRLLAALDYEALRRVHPRFVQWRQLHDHVVQARAFDPARWASVEAVAAEVPRWRHRETLTYVRRIEANLARLDARGRVVRRAQ